jgi:hypothetical protein
MVWVLPQNFLSSLSAAQRNLVSVSAPNMHFYFFGNKRHWKGFPVPLSSLLIEAR